MPSLCSPNAGAPAGFSPAKSSVLASVGSEAVGRHRSRPLPRVFVDPAPVQ